RHRHQSQVTDDWSERGAPGNPRRSFFRASAAAASAIDVPRAEHRGFGATLFFRSQASEVELLDELDPEFVRLRPADNALNGTHSDDVDGKLESGRYRHWTINKRTHRADVPQLHFQRLVVDAGDRPTHQPVPRFANALIAVGLDGDAVGELAGSLAFRGAAEDKYLNHADPELTDQLKVIVGFDTLGAGVHAERLGKGDDGADDRGVAVGGRRRAA